ncbi:MAG: type IV pilus biogenesis protein EbsA [Cyanobacteria bacterium P01_G01_bin.49]
MTTIDQIQPAAQAEVMIYLPYYQKDKHKILPYAISLYSQGNIEGIRRIEGSEGIPFVASWYVSKLPSELTRCRVQFDGQADLSYEMTILNAEFVDYMIGVIKLHQQANLVDFPQGFYRKLLQREESAS